jgi:flagellar biosynthetic protein FliP
MRDTHARARAATVRGLACAAAAATWCALPELAAADPGVVAQSLADLEAIASDPTRLTPVFRLAILMTILSLAPAIVMMITCFVRIAVVLSLMRQAIGVQQVPPTQVLMSLALFLTVFVMQPTFERAYASGVGPYLRGDLPDAEAFELTVAPFREYMLRQTRDQDLLLFEEISQRALPDDPNETPLTVLVPAYMLSELRSAFIIGFLLFLPFLVMDMVVASTLLSMGMIVVPPIMISLPLKLMLFVLVDGWNLIVGSIVRGLI